MEEIDTSRPHPARMYDFYLGDKDNYEVDREAAQRIVDLVPDVVPTAVANREFLRRAVRFAAERGVRQFIDIGTGIPTSPNTHEVARETQPRARVAYVDNDPIIAAHAGARLTNTADTGFLLADLREPQGILEHPTVRDLIDFDEPVALLPVAVLHFVTDEEDPYRIVATLRDCLPRGSHLVLSHVSADFHLGELPSAVREGYDKATASMNARTKDWIAKLFDGFELVEPGLVQAPFWWPDALVPESDERRRAAVYGGVGIKS
jgi:hypothetical protein